MYIGKTPTVGNFQVCDAISVVNGQAAYTLQVGGVNVAPESANHMLVSLNGILQKPGSSFTISGSTMTFASNLATGDVIDFVQILGNVLDIGQPSDDTVKTASLQANAVTGAKLNTDVISAQTALTSTPADTDEFLVSDAGTLKRIDFSLIKGGGMDLISNTTISSAGYTDITGQFSSTYKNYRIIGSGLKQATDNTAWVFQLRTSSAAITSGYYWAGVGQRGTGNTVDDGENNAADFRIIGNAANDNHSVNFDMTLYDPYGYQVSKNYTCVASGRRNNDGGQVLTCGGFLPNDTRMEGIRFLVDSGNVSAGTIQIFGIKDS